MLKLMVERQIVVITLGVFTGLGILSKCMVNAILARLVHAAGNMSKSTHPLMRLMRAKFEHACMVSETVENVEVFVDKYLYSYKVFGIRLHSLRRLEKASAFLCIVTGLLGAFFTYQIYGMNDLVLQTGAIGTGLGILVYVFHLTTDENYRIKMARNYMVDYLQNVCLHRYEKAYQKELEERMLQAESAEKAAGIQKTEDAIEAEEDFEEVDMETGGIRAEGTQEEAMHEETVAAAIKKISAEPEFHVVPERDKETETFGTVKLQAVSGRDNAGQERDTERTVFEEKKDSHEGTQQEFVEKEIRIRQILEEFMA